MRCAQWVSIEPVNTGRRYLVTNTRWTCKVVTELRPRRSSKSAPLAATMVRIDPVSDTVAKPRSVGASI